MFLGPLIPPAGSKNEGGGGSVSVCLVSKHIVSKFSIKSTKNERIILKNITFIYFFTIPPPPHPQKNVRFYFVTST